MAALYFWILLFVVAAVAVGRVVLKILESIKVGQASETLRFFSFLFFSFLFFSFLFFSTKDQITCSSLDDVSGAKMGNKSCGNVRWKGLR